MKRESGITLIELLIVLSIGTILIVLTVSGLFSVVLTENRLKSGLFTLYSDIIFAQTEAIKQGAYNISNGVLIKRKVFITFTGNNSYSIWRWEDIDGDNVAEAGEFDPDMAGGPDAPVKTVTLGTQSQISFGIPGYVTAGACDNGNLPPQAVTYPAVNLPVCNNCPTIELDANGFADSAGVIYLTNGSGSVTYAMSGNRAGIFTLCRWNSNTGQWDIIPYH